MKFYIVDTIKLTNGTDVVHSFSLSLYTLALNGLMQWQIYSTYLGRGTTKKNYVAQHCNIVTMQTTVLDLIISEISGWATSHWTHPVDLPLV
jgi:hypothetical protein